MIVVTERAAKKFKFLAEKEGKPPILRVGVKKGGCSGLSYTMDFVEAATEQDETLEVDGVLVVCDRESLQYLDGLELDFRTGLLDAGFKFRNPKATSSCKCGESFAV